MGLDLAGCVAIYSVLGNNPASPNRSDTKSTAFAKADRCIFKIPSGAAKMNRVDLNDFSIYLIQRFSGREYCSGSCKEDHFQ